MDELLPLIVAQDQNPGFRKVVKLRGPLQGPGAAPSTSGAAAGGGDGASGSRSGTSTPGLSKSLSGMAGRAGGGGGSGGSGGPSGSLSPEHSTTSLTGGHGPSAVSSLSEPASPFAPTMQLLHTVGMLPHARNNPQASGAFWCLGWRVFVLFVSPRRTETEQEKAVTITLIINSWTLLPAHGPQARNIVVFVSSNALSQLAVDAALAVAK